MSVNPPGEEPGVYVGSVPLIDADEITGYVEQSGRLNAKAALSSGVAVLLSVASTLVSAFA